MKQAKVRHYTITFGVREGKLIREVDLRIDTGALSVDDAARQARALLKLLCVAKIAVKR